jgi:hypothetical protein
MAKNKIDTVFDSIYSTHLNGGRANNPTNNVQSMIEFVHANKLVELCANRFEWTGLPDTVDTRFLELELCYKGLAVIYQDNDFPDGDLVAVSASGAGHTNFNGNPISFNVIGPGPGAGSAKILSAVRTRTGKDGETEVPAQCVPVWSNFTRRPEMDLIRIYAHRLAKLDRTIEITMDGMRKNKIVKAPENQRTSYVNIMRQIAEGQDVIFGTDNLDIGGTVEVLDLGIDPMNLPNLMIARSKLWNECMGLLGINNANQDKKERLVAAEVGANDEQVQASRNVALNARQTAAKQISDLYNITVTVDFKTPPPVPGDAPGEEFATGGGTSSDNQGAGANQ